jgi:hypothetical protein
MRMERCQYSLGSARAIIVEIKQDASRVTKSVEKINLRLQGT